jgi:hypothetical protein
MLIFNKRMNFYTCRFTKFATQHLKHLVYENQFYPPYFVKNLTFGPLLSFLFVFSITGAITQNNTNSFPWPQNGNVGIGTPAPNSQLQIHGFQSYSSPAGPIRHPDEHVGGGGGLGGINYGNTARLLFTTTTTTTNAQRGFEIRYSERHMVMRNLEDNGNFTLLATGTPSLTFNSNVKRVFLGSGATNPTWEKRASINIDHSSANGLYIRAANTNSYGLFIHSGPEQRALVIESGTGFNTTRNFQVTGDGFVFARRYTTTLGPIGDYVFAPNYYLMPLSDLRIFIRENSHLPNVIPTNVAETEETDLVEFAKTLLVKIEENLLYILQLEERIQQLEAER